MKGHRVGGCFAGVGNWHDDCVFVDLDQLFGSFLIRQFFAKVCASRINASVVQTAGDVGKVNPFEETMGSASFFGEGFDLHVAANDRDRVARFERFDRISVKPKIQQGHAFAGRRKQPPVGCVAHRFDAQWVTSDQHVTFGVEHG